MTFTRYYDQSITAPAGTPAASPVSVPIPLETNRLERIEIDVPDGHDRATGIRIVSNGTVIVPFSITGFIVANNHYFTIPFDDNITVNDLVIQAYNTDVFDHTFYLRFLMSNSVSPVTSNIVSAQVPGIVAPDALATVGTLAVTPDNLAAAASVPPAAPDLFVPPAPAQGVPQ